MTNVYSLIKPPFPLIFREMSKEQAKEYFEWFQSQIPERILVITRYIRSFSDYQTWEPDLNPSSLNEFGKWFGDRVQTRNRTRTEINSIYANAPGWLRIIEIPDWELTDQTFSLSIDIGMYLSQVLIHNIPGLKWKIGPKPKNSVDYQQPVQAGLGKLVFNPVYIVTTLAYGIARRNQGPDRLRDLYEIWANILRDD